MQISKELLYLNLSNLTKFDGEKSEVILDILFKLNKKLIKKTIFLLVKEKRFKDGRLLDHEMFEVQKSSF